MKQNPGQPSPAEQYGNTDRPDKYLLLRRQDAPGIVQVAAEWSTYGKKVDLTDVATTSAPATTLIRVEGSDAPRFLAGYGWMVDLEQSKANNKLVYRSLRELAEQRDGHFDVVIGDSFVEGAPAVSGVMQEEARASVYGDQTPEGPFDSPFYHAQAMLNNLPGNTERMNTIVEFDLNLAKLVQP
jgi:hypothetical protein